MNADIETAGNLLASILFENYYVAFLTRQLQGLGIRVGQAQFLLSTEEISGELSLTVCGTEDQQRAQLWVEMTLPALHAAVRDRVNVEGLVVRTGPQGQVVHPRLEELAFRCFQTPPYPIDDRESLVYPSLFGFADPKLVWQSTDTLLRVLYYSDPDHGSVAVSSGLSDRSLSSSVDPAEDDPSGSKYELMIRSNQAAVISRFAGWVEYVETSQQDIVPGNWLEFEGHEEIPGTDVAGFIVVTPISIPEHFPVGAASAAWHELLPVNLEQLQLAKQIGVFQVADMLRR